MGMVPIKLKGLEAHVLPWSQRKEGAQNWYT